MLRGRGAWGAQKRSAKTMPRASDLVRGIVTFREVAELVAGLGRFGFDDWGRSCGSGGEYGCLGSAFQKLLFPEAIESGLVTDISRHGSCFL